MPISIGPRISHGTHVTFVYGFSFFKRMVTNMLENNCAKLISLQHISICTDFSRYGTFQLDDTIKKLLVSSKIRVFLVTMNH
jgi:hypothetical protein